MEDEHCARLVACVAWSMLSTLSLYQSPIAYLERSSRVLIAHCDALLFCGFGVRYKAARNALPARF